MEKRRKSQKATQIQLHPKYGLNPTMSQCIICGEDTGEIVLLGNSYKDEAPRRMVTSIEPCVKCKEKYLTAGVLMVEADEKTRIPTGKLVVLKESAFLRVTDVPVPKGRIVLVEPGVLQRFGITTAGG